MPTKRDGQRWILDTLLGVGGFDVLHPGAVPVMLQFGYDQADLERIFDGASAGLLVRDRMGARGQEVERKAEYWDGRGFQRTAARLYLRASLIYGRTYYSYFGDDPRRMRYLNRCLRAFDKVMEFADHHVERVQIPFQGSTVYGIYESPRGTTNAPCVVMLPGMDMVKEEWHHFITRHVIPRGWSALSLDGPGQGETLTRGLKVGLNTYEEGVSAAIDWLQTRPEVDAARIGLMGVSMGSHWGTRAAAKDHRVAAVATSMSNYGDKHIIFNIAQPNFKANFMYMAGITDEAEFDALAEQMVNTDLYPQIECPTLMITGEYDELTLLQDTFDAYDRVTAPKELWVFGEEFHPIGPASDEWLAAWVDWVEGAMAGAVPSGHDRRTYITRDGRFLEGSGEPPAWNPE